MRASSSRSLRQPAKHNQAPAFTLVELLVVLAVLGLLACLAFPALAGSKSQTGIAQCAGNLRQLVLATQLYAGENSDRFPQWSGGNWLWDQPPSYTSQLARFGATRQQMYDPANPDQNADGLWNFSPGYRVIGYALTLPGSSVLIASNANPTLTQAYPQFGSIRLPPDPPSKRALVADVILSPPGQANTANKLSYQYTGISGGFSIPHRTSHLEPVGRYPAGGNVGMLDGHVEWRSFQEVVCRTQGSSPGFWW